MTDDTPPPSNEETAPKPRAPGWMRIALILSLAVNVLIVGTIAGAVLSGRAADRGTAEQVRQITPGPYSRALPQEYRRAMRQELRDNRQALRQHSRVLRSSFQETVTLLEAETLDMERLEILLTDQRTNLSTLQSHGHTALIAVIGQMSVADRQSYAQRLREQGPKRRTRDQFQRRRDQSSD
ncbi:MAG: periplasmic heavy metal sensor [Pseudomonadota bacterium]